MAFLSVPIGGYSNVTQVVSAAAQVAILAEIDKFLAVIPNSSTGAAGKSPDYDAIRADVETNIRKEVAALKAAIDAAPTS